MLYFIVNEKSKSGKGNSVWSQIVGYLDSRQLEYMYWITKYQGHAREIAEEISLLEEDEKRLIIVGGDGTINGKLTYLLLTVKSLFTMETANGTVRMTRRDKKKEKHMQRLIFSAVMNFRAEGGGVPMAPAADARDGRLSMCCASDISRWKTFFYLPVLVLAKHSNLKGITIADEEEIHWKVDVPMTLHTDGEYCGEVTEVKFTCLKGKLRVLV